MVSHAYLELVSGSSNTDFASASDGVKSFLSQYFATFGNYCMPHNIVLIAHAMSGGDRYLISFYCYIWHMSFNFPRPFARVLLCINNTFRIRTSRPADTGDMWPTARPAATANDDFKNVLLFDITFFLYSTC